MEAHADTLVLRTMAQRAHPFNVHMLMDAKSIHKILCTENEN